MESTENKTIIEGNESVELTKIQEVSNIKERLWFATFCVIHLFIPR